MAERPTPYPRAPARDWTYRILGVGAALLGLVAVVCVVAAMWAVGVLLGDPPIN